MGNGKENNQKSQAYLQLVRESQEEYRNNPSDHCDDNITLLAPDVTVAVVDGKIKILDTGVSICKEINLYTYWQGFGYAEKTPEIKYLLVAQDFGNPFNFQHKCAQNIISMNEGKTDIHYLSDVTVAPGSTDDNLIKLFEVLGYKDSNTIKNKRIDDLFFTNFSLGYRTGKDSGSMSKALMMKDSDYFKRLCDILEPKNILCLGRLTYECVYESLTGEQSRKLGIGNYNDYIASGKFEDLEKYTDFECRIFPLAHCGYMGTMNRNKIVIPKTNKLITDPETKNDVLKKQINDWKYVAQNSL